MAFKMNRPIIKGTSIHKASIAKAKPVVSQRRTRADASLVASAEALGESYKPSKIDFEIDQYDIDVPKRERTKKRKETDYGTYDDYLKDHKEEKSKMSEEDKAAYGDPLSKEEWTDLNVEAGMKRPKAKKERVKKEKGENIFERGYKSIKDKIREARLKKIDRRLERSMKGIDDGDNDFSQIESEPSLQEREADVYRSPEAGTIESEELLSQTKASRNKALQDAAKKYNVKIEDLEAKEIDGKRDFFPKQGTVGGQQETQWDDKLGRFRKAEATMATEEEEQAAVEAMKPKYQTGMNPNQVPNQVKTGEIALNYETNTYEYTQQYFDRLAKEQIERKQQQQNTTSTTTEPVVEEKKISTARQRRLDRKYKDAGPSVRANMIEDGYVPPPELKTAMKMRDDRIYKHAVKGGVVRKNMIKGGYIPPNER